MASTGDAGRWVEAAVAAIEARTGAEVVVVQSRRSDGWWDLRLGMGAVCGWATLAALCWLPYTFHDLLLPVYTLALGAVGVAVGGTAAVIRQVPGATRRARVLRAARAAFLEEAVHTTPERIGVLVYVSELEGQIVVLADEGVLVRLPTIESTRIQPDTLPDDLARLGDLLADAIPRRADDKNHLADGARVRR